MKKNFEEVIMECVLLAEEDILTASNEMGGFDTPYDEF